MLNDLKRPENMHSCEFHNRRDMASHCHYVWIRFFWYLRSGEPRVDLAVWEIGDRINVRPASTATDESNPEFVRPHPLYFELRGYQQLRHKIQKRKDASCEEIEAELQALEAERLEWMKRAIVEGLAYKNAQTAYRKYNPEDLPFAAMTTFCDEGLHASEFQVAWKNERGSTPAMVRKRAAARRNKELPTQRREDSVHEQHMAKLKKERRLERDAARKYWAAEKERANKQKPAAHRKFAKRIEQALAELPPARSKRKQSASPPRPFPWSLDDGNQHELLVVPTVDLDALVSIHLTYNWSSFDEYDNRVWEYSYALLDPAIKKAGVNRTNTLWRRMNRPQKVFYTFLAFIGQVDNGGVWQFLFNAPELSLAALESMQELGATKLTGDYRRTLEELVGKSQVVSDLRRRFSDHELDSAKRWQAFAEGYSELQATAAIEEYVYSVSFKRSFFRKMSDYLESSFHLLARIRGLRSE